MSARLHLFPSSISSCYLLVGSRGVPWHRLAEPTGLCSVDTTKALTHTLVIKAQFPLPSLALKVRLPFQQLVAEGGDVEEQNYLWHRHVAVGLSASQKNKKRNPVKSIAPRQSSSQNSGEIPFCWSPSTCISTSLPHTGHTAARSPQPGHRALRSGAQGVQRRRPSSPGAPPSPIPQERGKQMLQAHPSANVQPRCGDTAEVFALVLSYPSTQRGDSPKCHGGKGGEVSKRCVGCVLLWATLPQCV